MIVKAGEVICVASGVFEQYDRAGPFAATQDFDLDVFVEKVMPPTAEQREIGTETLPSIDQSHFSMSPQKGHRDLNLRSRFLAQ